MEDIPDGQATIDIQVVRWRWHHVSPRIRVVIDRTCVGLLTDQQVWSFPVAPGLRKVKVWGHLMRSETVDLSLSPGDRVALKCGLHEQQVSGLLVMAMVLMTIPMLTMPLGLYDTGNAALGLAMVLQLIWMWRSFLKPGSSLYLRPRTDSGVPAVEIPSVMGRPRITIRQGMIVVAVLALLLAAGVQERRMKHRTQYQWQAHFHRQQAEWHAKQESDAKNHVSEAQWEEAELKYRDTLSDLSRSNPGDRSLQAKLRDAERWLKAARSLRAFHAQLAAYHAQLKENHLYAAEHPWEPMWVDPPMPVIDPSPGDQRAEQP